MPHSIAAVATDLRRLGVETGDVLMVHASMRALGPVEGGAAGVVAAIDAAVGSVGTTTMNLGAMVSSEPFDARSTPADPDVGVLAEVFRCMPGTSVSDHPDARFGARGRLAAQLLADPPWHDYYGPGSILDRFAEAGGKVLRLGADLDTVTLIHLAEYLADVPDKRRVRRRHHLRDRSSGRTIIREVSCLDDSAGIRPWPDGDYFEAILSTYLTNGHARTGLVAGAQSELLDGRDLVRFATDWIASTFAHGTDG